MNDTALILCPSDTLTPAVLDEAKQLIEEALAGTALIGAITNEAQNVEAVAAVSKVSALKKRIEKSHKEAKLPYLRVCQLLDETKRNLVADLEREELRVNTESGNWNMAKEEQRREEERQRQRELDRLDRERRAEEARLEAEARKAEEARQEKIRQAEAEALAARSKKAKAEAEARRQELERQAEADRAKAEQERKDREALAEQERLAMPAPVLAKTEGQRCKIEWDYEVTDIWKLLRARPDLVNVTERRQDILDIIASGIREIGGLRIFERAKVSAKAPARKAIDI